MDNQNPYSSPAADSRETATSNESKQSAGIDFEKLPTLYRDSSFWGMTVTQFLGAFNDNVFKQIALLLTVNVVVAGNKPQDFQAITQAVFAIPFVLFSGISGILADRVSKRTVIIFCKYLEILVMLAGAVALGLLTVEAVQAITDSSSSLQKTKFLTYGMPWSIWAVLFFMGTQSAIFGPSKYGILPEMVRPSDLPRFNGVIQMTTFVGIIIGAVFAGTMINYLIPMGFLWAAGMCAVGIAIAGTVTSYWVRRTPIAKPDAKVTWSSAAMSPEVFRLLKKDRLLRNALIISCMFWFVGAMVLPCVNAYGSNQLELDPVKTSMLAASVAVGIAIGCIVAGIASRSKIRFGFVRLGAWGILISLGLLALPGVNSQNLFGFYGSLCCLLFMGFFAGILAVPIQVFIQDRPSYELKGQMIGSMNFLNWVGMLAASGCYFLSQWLMETIGLPISGTFAISAIVMLPVAILYRPQDIVLKSTRTST